MFMKQRLLVGLGVLSLFAVSAQADDVVSVADSVSPLMTEEAPAAGTLLQVADFGTVGDGVHDDGPAIAAAFAAAKEDGGPSTVVLEKKTYRLGGNPAAWHYFQMEDHEDLVIEGRGAILHCSEANLAFLFEGGRNITVRGLVFDTIRPTFTQGEVVAVDEDGTLDVRIMEGYPEPPDEAFLAANKHRAHGGGGRHMIVFEKSGAARNTGMGNDHLYIRNITRVTPGVFRFHVKEDYLPAFPGVAIGNWVSYGFNKVNLPAAVVATKNKSASIYAQIAAVRVENITFEDIDIFGSLNGGIRVSDMPGDVTIRNVNIIRKPGTPNLLSTPSDALHLMNIRGRLLMENCVIESAGDDCLNVGTMLERIVGLSETDNKTMTLRTLDNYYYYYTIRSGDGVYNARGIEITDNVFEVGVAKAIRISGVQSLTSRGNTFKQNGIPVKDASIFTVFSRCVDAMVEH